MVDGNTPFSASKSKHFSVLIMSFLLLYIKMCYQLSRNINILSFSSVLTYFVMDTSLSNEAVKKTKAVLYT